MQPPHGLDTRLPLKKDARRLLAALKTLHKLVRRVGQLDVWRASGEFSPLLFEETFIALVKLRPALVAVADVMNKATLLQAKVCA